MKRLYTFLIVAVIFSSWLNVASAQVVNIPDPNLEAALRELFEANNVLGPNEPITREHMALILSVDLRGQNIKDLTGLEYATNIEALGISFNQISDLRPLRRLTQLVVLEVFRNQISDLTPLSDLTQLERLIIGTNQISDLTPLSGLTQLERLALNNNQISDISPLAGLTHLENLFLEANQINDVSPLAGLTQLKELWLDQNNIRDVSPLASLVNLETLTLVGNPIADTSPLADLPKLVNVDVQITAPGGTNLIPDRNLAAAVRGALGLDQNATITEQTMRRLRSLTANGRQITDLTGLEHATQLERLLLNNNQISNLNPLSELTQLEELELWRNQITDVSPVTGLTQLQNLVLADNQIRDVSPLAGLTQLKSLALANNQIRDVSPLAGLTLLERLHLHGNQIRDVSPLAGLINLTQLLLAGNPITDTSPLASLTKLVDVDVEITEPPAPSLIPDPNLAAAIREALGLSRNAPITRQAVQRLSGLLVIDSQVKDLTGLEHATQLVLLGLHNGEIRDLRPITGLTKLRSLGFSNNQISDIRPLAGLTRLRELYLDGNRIRDVSPLAELTRLELLYLNRNQIRDVSPLTELTELKELYLASNPIEDTSPLVNLPNLVNVDIEIAAPSLIPDPNLAAAVRETLGLGSNAPIDTQTLQRLTTLNAERRRVTNLTGLEHATQLRELHLNRNQISDVSPLAGLTRLERLILWSNRISDVSPLAGLTQLNRLHLAGNQISNVGPLANLTRLSVLFLNGNQIQDVSPLAGLVNLTRLRLEGNPITDTSPLASLTKLTDVDIEITGPSPDSIVQIPDRNLAAAVQEALGLAPNAFITKQAMSEIKALEAEGVNDLTGLEHATQLESISFLNNGIQDLSPLANLTNLTSLDLTGASEIQDLSPLRNLTNLTSLDLTGGTRINDFSPLTSLTGLTSLGLFDAGIDDEDLLVIAMLTNLTALGLGFNEITDVSPLAANLTNLTWLAVRENPIQDLSPLANLRKLVEVDVEIISPSVIPDPNLAAAVRKALNLPAGAAITEAQLATLTVLNAEAPNVPPEEKITDLTGLEHATALRELNLNFHQISDITPLTGLTQLRKLSIWVNRVSDISPLAGLRNLTHLLLQVNAISDVSPLAGLTNLEYLALEDNSISDISPLDELSENTHISWSGNPGFPTGGPKIRGPWLWVLVPGTRLDDSTDFLARASGGTVTEQQIATKGADQGAVVGDRVWTPHKLSTTETNNINELTAALGWGTGPAIYNHIVYGSIVLDSPREQHTKLFVGSDDAVKVWLNGELVHQALVGRGARDYQAFSSVTLKEGLNVLLVAVDNHGLWDFSGFFGFAPDAGYTALPPTYVRMPDPSLQEAVRRVLGLASDDTLTQEVLQGLTQLTLSGDVSDLTGLEYATRLAELSLTSNQISDISPLAGLTQLTALVLDDNQISDITPIARLTQLSVLGLRDNQINDISPLTGLTQLIGLDLYGNRISDISPLTGLVNLNTLLLAENPISDTAPLRTLLENNPSVHIDIDVRLAEDVNNDGVVNIQDLVFVASNFGQIGKNAADVDGNGVVNIQDLVLVAGAFGNAAAAPIGQPQRLQSLTAGDVEQWLSEAQDLDLTDVTTQRGIRFLEQLLASLIPTETALLPNYPNPFNPETWIPYQLAKPADVTLTIYTVNGWIVRQLSVGHQHAGTYQSKSRAVYWDGKNAVGEPVASGLYFYTLTAGDFTATRKMLIRK